MKRQILAFGLLLLASLTLGDECSSRPSNNIFCAIFDVQQYYYDVYTNNCELMRYGECGSDGNNYDSIFECQHACDHGGNNGNHGNNYDKNCYDQPDSGPGQAGDIRFYYDSYTGRCEEFTYGGYGGNGNNYLSVAACSRKCERTGGTGPVSGRKTCNGYPQTSHCTRQSQRFYYDSSSGRCRQFFGCGRSGNVYRTRRACENKCAHTTTTYPGVGNGRLCSGGKDAGNCYGYNLKYYYDRSARKCQEFVYGGCGGNSNNRFDSLSACRNRCENGRTGGSVPRGSNKCYARLQEGHCSSRIQKYYFERTTETCKVFSYSGCGGNGNRFDTYEDCYNQCSFITTNH